MLRARHTAADRIDDPLGHPSHREATVESETLSTEAPACRTFQS